MRAKRPGSARSDRLSPVLLRLARELVVPLLVAVPPLFWVVLATKRASLTPLGRDQGIFQYIAWAVARGEVDYRDVRDVNGPLTHMVHRALLALGGADEHRFRVLDLAITGATFAFAGGCLPGLRGRRTPTWIERLAWALAGWVVLSGQYLLYGYWDLAQRESFFDWLLLPSLGVQLLAQSPTRSGGGRVSLLALSGALSVAPWFGKPTYAIFTAAQVLGLLLDPGLAGGRLLALAGFGLGGIAGAAVPLGWLARSGDVRAYLRMQLVDVPAMYRFIWPRSAADIFAGPWDASQAIYALVGAMVFVGLVATREMPARVLPVALAPLGALAGIVAQGKAFPYHFHPVTACVHLEWLVFVAWLSERTRTARRDRALGRLAPVAVAAALTLRVATSMEDSPHVRATWMLWGAQTYEDRQSEEYFAHFPEVDYFGYDLEQTAIYLREQTEPGDRVQTYGMDPYVLFQAERLSASPYIYAYDLDVDAALAGGTGGAPDEAEQERIQAMREAHEVDLLVHLKAHPPAAFVFFDGAPLLQLPDAETDFAAHCPLAWAWFHDHYLETAQFGHDHVWMRAHAPDETEEPEDPLDPR